MNKLLLTPEMWVKLTGIEVLDADGWQRGTWDVPITLRMFIENTHSSTCRNHLSYEKAAKKASLNFATWI